MAQGTDEQKEAYIYQNPIFITFDRFHRNG